MKFKVHHNIIFLIIITCLIALMIHPSIFQWANRIEPWILGIPFSAFWLILLNFCICGTFIVWYYTDTVKGNIDIDIEQATEEELNELLGRGGRK
ncbi:hypothetical protein SAMN05192534_13411 [Alteribacillus persepolensis]|uniref:DUF3311 domain-containing protein n=1 Tax=Alteribacillus persepolensis TaxID=568899 RepID=A0A1G8JLH3_9BACI|nr:hypothetical protein [Alteribacillus persepolensis]SDI31921.1 hypothetical protein SAMN05192534_13411 [Alteribacillus persepolensis]